MVRECGSHTHEGSVYLLLVEKGKSRFLNGCVYSGIVVLLLCGRHHAIGREECVDDGNGSIL